MKVFQNDLMFGNVLNGRGPYYRNQLIHPIKETDRLALNERRLQRIMVERLKNPNDIHKKR